MDKIPDSAKEYNRITVIRLPAPEPTTGEIHVSSSPTSASVYLDGTDKGKTPTTLNDIEQGPHTVTLKLAGYEDWSQTVNVKAAKTILISSDLTPIEGNISVSSSPKRARVYIDGTYKGETPTILNNIEKGFHEITLKLEGYEDWTQTINVDVGKTAQVLAELTPIEPTEPEIKITSPVDGALVDVTEDVKGTQENIPKDKAIWIVVFPYKSYNYHPVKEVYIQDGVSDFSVPVTIGRPESVGKKFNIIAVLADKQAQEVFTSYLNDTIRAYSETSNYVAKY